MDSICTFRICEYQGHLSIKINYSINFRENNYVTSCNHDCSCSLERTNHVCGDDHVLFPSPCHAGCDTGFQNRVRVHSHGAKVEAKVKILIDACRFFFDLFRLYLVFCSNALRVHSHQIRLRVHQIRNYSTFLSLLKFTIFHESLAFLGICLFNVSE